MGVNFPRKETAKEKGTIPYVSRYCSNKDRSDKIGAVPFETDCHRSNTDEKNVGEQRKE
jgi:hypothetical protein